MSINKQQWAGFGINCWAGISARECLLCPVHLLQLQHDWHP